MWAGQCLEYDIGAQASTVPELVEYLVGVIDAERQESLERANEEFAGIPKAPAYFWDLWDKRAGEFLPEKSPARASEVDIASQVQYALAAAA